ncbi:RICIN domain-containing protein [Streptomyces sp. NPDC005571]|uniref:RICIN domain-containing protein n=1 Tax=Streptomyces sp. NPDC005571 TaxID=3156888 RepID=UPI0033A4162B
MPDRRTGDVRKRQKGTVTITTCAGTPGPLTTWTYGAHGSIVNDATGQCLYTPGGRGTGHRVELRDCTGKADQRWIAPRS